MEWGCQNMSEMNESHLTQREKLKTKPTKQTKTKQLHDLTEHTGHLSIKALEKSLAIPLFVCQEPVMTASQSISQFL